MIGRGLVVCVCVVALGACGKEDAGDKPASNVVASRVLSDVELALPAGWTKSYDDKADAWRLASIDSRTIVRVERADERYVASPDAYMQHLAPAWGDKLVTIEDRGAIGRNGFAMVLAIYAGENDANPLRVLYVVRQLGRIWYRCYAEGLDDEARRNEVSEVCRSIRAGA